MECECLFLFLLRKERAESFLRANCFLGSCLWNYSKPTVTFFSKFLPKIAVSSIFSSTCIFISYKIPACPHLSLGCTSAVLKWATMFGKLLFYQPELHADLDILSLQHFLINLTRSAFSPSKIENAWWSNSLFMELCRASQTPDISRLFGDGCGPRSGIYCYGFLPGLKTGNQW